MDLKKKLANARKNDKPKKVGPTVDGYYARNNEKKKNSWVAKIVGLKDPDDSGRRDFILEFLNSDSIKFDDDCEPGDPNPRGTRTWILEKNCLYRAAITTAEGEVTYKNLAAIDNKKVEEITFTQAIDILEDEELGVPTDEELDQLNNR